MYENKTNSCKYLANVLGCNAFALRMSRQRGPDGRHIGDGAAGPGELFHLGGVGGIKVGRRAVPLRVRVHRRDEDGVALGTRGVQLFDDLAERRGELIGRDFGGGVVHAEGADEKVRRFGEHGGHLLEPPIRAQADDGEILQFDF